MQRLKLEVSREPGRLAPLSELQLSSGPRAAVAEARPARDLDIHHATTVQQKHLPPPQQSSATVAARLALLIARHADRTSARVKLGVPRMDKTMGIKRSICEV